jgi:basic amino acid/polyamine antiporter, APA family
MDLFARKPLDQLQAEAEGSMLRRTLGPWNLTALGVGAIIGTGIFVLTGTTAAANAGPAIVVSMIISAVGCVFSGLCYAEFAAMVPVAGSAYTYAYATMGELIAWIIGWDLILEYALAISTVAVGWSGYFVSFMHNLGIDIPMAWASAPSNLPAAAIVLVVTGLLVVGIRESANTNTVLVFIKSAVLIVFVVAGAGYVRWANLTPFVPANTGHFGEFGWSGVLRGAGIMFFAFIGFDAVSTAAQEAKNPARDMPIGILLSLGICTILYILVAVVLMGIVPYSTLNVADPLAVGIDATGLRWLSPVIKIAALFGLFSTMVVNLIGQTRIFFSMSRDGLLPPLFARVHPRFRTPHVSTIITGLIIALVAGVTPITVLSQLVSMGTFLAFVLVSLGVIVLRHTAPEWPRPFRAPAVPLVPILGAVFCIVQMLSLPQTTWVRLIVWLVVGLVVYFAYGRMRALQAREIRRAS